MSPPLARLFRVWIALLLGVAAGGLVGLLAGAAQAGAWIGAVSGVGVAALADGIKAGRLLGWLRGAQETAAPRDGGFWGEMGYRVERALRVRERRIADEAERLRQFLSAIEVSPNGVLLLDARDHIDWCNARAADHFGLDPVRDRAQKVTNLVRAPAFVQHLQEGDFSKPLEFAAGPGRVLLSVLVRPYGDGQRLVLSQDITERARSDAMRRDFVANVSHELRTPVTVLAGFVDTLESVPLTAVEQPRVLSLMRQQTSRIQSLVEDLLTLAQLEGSPRPSTDRWVEVDPLLDRVHADAQALSNGRHALTLNAQRGCRVAGVESELISAMLNLASNAVRYTPDGGRVEMSWKLREADGCGVFEVRDSGVGIAREHLPRLTERFYRVEGSRSRETGGTGLGLAIVKHVVQRHGGELEVESELGRGSTFRLVLPGSRVRAASAAAT